MASMEPRALAAAALLLLAGCNDANVTGDDDAAVDYVSGLLGQYFADCDGDWTVETEPGAFQQLRDLSLEIESLPVEAADAANGLEYVGLVGKGAATMVREAEGAGWRPWQAGADFPRPKIERRGGVWSHSDAGAPAFRGRPADCAALPEG